VNIRAAGDTALLVEAGAGPPVPARLAAAIAALRLPGVSDIIPGAETVLLITEPGQADLGALRDAVLARGDDPPEPPGCAPRPRGGTSPTHRPLAGPDGPDSLAGNERLAAARGEAGSDADADAGAGAGADAGAGAGSDAGAGAGSDAGAGAGAEAKADADAGAGGDEDEGVAEIPVVYDGADLAEVAELTGLSEQEVVARHAAGEYEVGWLGFSPGFAYLTGLDPALHVPRLDSPRTSVPAGSVAIAGPLAAVYPAASPGGWRLLGRTTARLWDPAREPPAALGPGRRVRFRPVDGTGEQGEAGDIFPGGTRALAGTPDSGNAVIEVIQPGPLATVVDLGRPGYGHLGVLRSGAADAGSLRLANRLVGNPEDAAALELTLGGTALLFRAPAWAALTGAQTAARLQPGPQGAPGQPGPQERLRRSGDHSGMGVPFAVPAGTVLTVPPPQTGVRSYLAVRGGISVPPVLGSRSSDRLSGLGHPPLRPGDLLPVGPTSGCLPILADLAPLPAAAAGPAELRIVAGPRDDWFADGALPALCSAAYVVTSDSDRSALRLSGPSLPRARDGELPSEGMVTGALQVPPDGQPILFLTDHPVTGGYPVAAVVVAADIGPAAQLRPGEMVRFRRVQSPLGQGGRGRATRARSGEGGCGETDYRPGRSTAYAAWAGTRRRRGEGTGEGR